MYQGRDGIYTGLAPGVLLAKLYISFFDADIINLKEYFLVKIFAR